MTMVDVDQASSTGNDDNYTATAPSSSSSPLSTSITNSDDAESIMHQGGSSGVELDNLRSNIIDDDDDDDNDYISNEPLLSSFFKKSVKLGPFSIKYNNPSSPRVKPSRLYYEQASSSSGQFHDFVKSNDSHLCGSDDDGCQDDDDELDDGDVEFDHGHHHSKHGNKISIIAHSILHKIQQSACCKTNIKILPLRILLLALYLAFTLSSFWLLDSIKEPTLAMLVGGELGKHQPRAKMVSFVVVVVLAVVMEWADQLRQRRRRRRQSTAVAGEDHNIADAAADVNAALERSWEDRNLPNSMRSDDNNEAGNSSGHRRWRKMGIRTSKFWKHFHWSSYGDSDEMERNASSSSKITTLAFYVVGSLYIHAFVTVAVALREHPSFRPNETASLARESETEREREAAGIADNQTTETREVGIRLTDFTIATKRNNHHLKTN